MEEGQTKIEPTYLYDYDSEKNSYVVNNYPWGFSLKTKRRYWIETKDTKRGGERLCYSTLNPKTDCWCKPVKATYSKVLFLTSDSRGHVGCTGLSSWSTAESIAAFYKKHEDYLSDYQVKTIKDLIAMQEVMKHVEFKVVPSSVGGVILMSNKKEDVEKRRLLAIEQKEAEERQKKIDLQLNKMYNFERSRVQL